MKITLIGGHGKVALLAEPLLTQAGHEVRAVIRNPEHGAEVEATGAQAVVADAQTLDADGWDALLAGSDAVVWSAGAGGGSPERTYAIDRDAAIASMDAAARVGARRYIMVSYFGAGPDHGVPEDHSFFPYADAKAAADAHLRGTDLDWTILGPSGLTLEEPTGRIDTAAASSGTVSRANVAQVIAATIERPGLAGRTIPFNDGEQEIGAALDALAG
ncbi:NAD(P)H-binding protein [Brachybacterium phenoliresistens]|uniref:NAD(P)H-binding protein n=1 Tax=Brachybacterium phenoliresistens TaxID=396014 RepID=UPI0031E289F2